MVVVAAVVAAVAAKLLKMMFMGKTCLYDYIMLLNQPYIKGRYGFEMVQRFVYC